MGAGRIGKELLSLALAAEVSKLSRRDKEGGVV